MSALIINDLPIGKELDREAMASITGGHGGRKRKKGRGQRNEVNIDISGTVIGPVTGVNNGDVDFTVNGGIHFH